MPRDNDGYDDRPKKSWSEIDKLRDGGRSRSSSPPAERERLERSTSYSRYKSAADKFFSGELLPEGLEQKLDPSGGSKAKKEALAKLRQVEDFREFATQGKAFVDEHGVPEDPYVVDRLLGHPNEGVVEKTLDKLSELLHAGAFKVPRSLPERLKSLELSSDNPELQQRARALAKELRDRPK